MTTFQKFEDIGAWQKARELVNEVYVISRSGSFSKDFILRDQIRRASVSVIGNIAEGFERDGKGEFTQFLSIAKGSIGELRTYLYIAKDQRYISEREFKNLFELANEIARMISGLMNYLRKSGMKGRKFKVIIPLPKKTITSHST